MLGMIQVPIFSLLKAVLNIGTTKLSSAPLPVWIRHAEGHRVRYSSVITSKEKLIVVVERSDQLTAAPPVGTLTRYSDGVIALTVNGETLPIYTRNG